MQTDIAYLDQLDKHTDTGENTRSIIDLIEGKTVSIDLAAFMVSKVRTGASFITGSGPGGIGKTTTMHTLLPFVPANMPFVTALPGKISATIEEKHCCVISNELSDHPPPTYLWDNDLRSYFKLSESGHILVSNVHADDHEETFHQIVTQNNVPERQFYSINLLVFICLEGGNPPKGRIKDNVTRRIINKVFYTDGQYPHKLVYTPEVGLSNDDTIRNERFEKETRSLLEDIIRSGKRSNKDIRQHFLQLTNDS